MSSKSNTEIIQNLEKFSELLKQWEYKEKTVQLRSQISKRSPRVRKDVIKAGTFKTFTITPPRFIGGPIMQNVDPFACIFEPPYGQSNIPMLIDMIDEAIGVIDATPNFGEEPTMLSPTNKNTISNRVFLVHGRDNELKETTARFLEKLGLEPIILHEQSNKGRTIIEKFEDFSDVAFAVILMTPDDLGYLSSESNTHRPRARQNVVFELGYFIGKLSRKNVAAIVKDDIEIPSDFSGIIYIGLDNSGAWKMLLAKEIKEAGLDIDLNNLL